MKEKFIKFLKDMHVYDEFVMNHTTTIDSVINHFPLSPECWISAAFFWNKSPEGHAFWKRIDDAWHNELKED